MVARVGFEPTFPDPNSGVLPIRRPGTLQRLRSPVTGAGLLLSKFCMPIGHGRLYRAIYCQNQAKLVQSLTDLNRSIRNYSLMDS